MADKLLIRMFDVGLGDCIYCRIPGAHRDGRDFHILIDCGTLSSTEYLKKAVTTLKSMLPEEDGRSRIDLLVVTHEHKDHMTGFGLPIWDDFVFGAIWMSAAMNPDHPQAELTLKLRSFASRAMAEAIDQGMSLHPQLMDMAAALALNESAMTALRRTLPEQSGIEPTYVHAGIAKSKLRLPLKGARIQVLGPEQDIDYYYLGDPGDPDLRRGLRSTLSLIGGGLPEPADTVSLKSVEELPHNISAGDFRRLRARTLSTALAFGELDGKVCNNTSVVLLIEWKGHRLLFVGDAEWDREFREGVKGNCSWNVMWNHRNALLNGPVSFLKIGHHGSTNATPWPQPGIDGSEPLEILDAILPVASKKNARAVVSTKRSTYKTIPRSDLLAEIGRRVSSTRNYATAFEQAGIPQSDVPKFDEFEAESFDSRQPLRTDLERLLQDQGYIDVELEA